MKHSRRARSFSWYLQSRGFSRGNIFIREGEAPAEPIFDGESEARQEPRPPNERARDHVFWDHERGVSSGQLNIIHIPEAMTL